MLLLEIFYIALFLALIFFGPLQEYLEKKKPQWDQITSTSDPEKMGLIMCIVLIILASTFFIGKIL